MKTREELIKAHDYLVLVNNTALDMKTKLKTSHLAATIFALKWALELEEISHKDKVFLQAINGMVELGKELAGEGGYEFDPGLGQNIKDN